jgi:diacylglycerol kinase
MAEITNTALEKTLDLVSPEHSLKVKTIKDMTAGAVLVASVGAVIIGVAIFYPYLLGWLWRR